MLENLKKKNPDIKIYSVFDEEFRSFGRVITELDADELVRAGEKLEMPESGVKYMAGMDEFESLDGAESIKNEIFGTLPTEIGCCWGHSSFLNATEWHTSSEINIAVTPLVLILGHRWDIVDGKIDSSKFTAFYLPKGTVIDCFATTLHYCPCQVSDEGFICIVALPKGTNTALETELKDKRISAKNKWIICHTDNSAAIARGIKPGISGINYEIKY